MIEQKKKCQKDVPNGDLPMIHLMVVPSPKLTAKALDNRPFAPKGK